MFGFIIFAELRNRHSGTTPHWHNEFDHDSYLYGEVEIKM